LTIIDVFYVLVRIMVIRGYKDEDKLFKADNSYDLQKSQVLNWESGWCMVEYVTIEMNILLLKYSIVKWWRRHNRYRCFNW